MIISKTNTKIKVGRHIKTGRDTYKDEKVEMEIEQYSPNVNEITEAAQGRKQIDKGAERVLREAQQKRCPALPCRRGCTSVDSFTPNSAALIARSF